MVAVPGAAAAAAHHEDIGEDRRQHGDDAYHHEELDDAAHLRQDDVPEPLPPVGTFDLRRLDHGFVKAEKPRKKQG